MRALLLRVIIQDRTEQQENVIIDYVESSLAGLAGEPRPTLEIQRNEDRTVAVSGT